VAAKQSNSDDLVSDINIVPLVDIILVVLIIFMVTSQANQQQKKMDVELPQASSSKPSEDQALKVILNQSGDIVVNGRMVSEFELRDLIMDWLKENQLGHGLLLADQRIEYGKAVRLLDWMRQSGVQDVSIGVGDYQ